MAYDNLKTDLDLCAKRIFDKTKFKTKIIIIYYSINNA